MKLAAFPFSFTQEKEDIKKPLVKATLSHGKKTLHKHNDVEVLPVTDCRTHINPVDRQRQRDTHTETLSLPRILRSSPRVTFSLDPLSLSLSQLFFFVFILRAPFSISVLTLHFFLLHALTHRERGISVSSPIREVPSFLHSLIAFLFYYLGLGFRGFFLDLLDFFFVFLGSC